MDPAKNIVSDPSYISCQRSSTATYSPGVCPDGHSVAEVTASFFSSSDIIKTFWQASCCKSGMTLGPEYPTACISHIVTPLRARALVTAIPGLRDAIPTPAYEYTIQSQTNSTVSNVVTVTSGLAIADPIVVRWQKDELSQFPRDYASSLAEYITRGPEWGVASATGSSSPTSPSTPGGLSTKAKVGISVGVAIGVLLFILGAVILLLRKRRKRIAASKEHSASDTLADDDHHRRHWWNLGGQWGNEAPADNAKHEMHVENKQHELASEANENELDSKAMKSELDTTVAQFELDSKSVLNELDSRAVHVVPGPPAELTGVGLQKNTGHREEASQ